MLANSRPILRRKCRKRSLICPVTNSTTKNSTLPMTANLANLKVHQTKKKRKLRRMRSKKNSSWSLWILTNQFLTCLKPRNKRTWVRRLGFSAFAACQTIIIIMITAKVWSLIKIISSPKRKNRPILTFLRTWRYPRKTILWSEKITISKSRGSSKTNPKNRRLPKAIKVKSKAQKIRLIHPA